MMTEGQSCGTPTRNHVHSLCHHDLRSGVCRHCNSWRWAVRQRGPAAGRRQAGRDRRRLHRDPFLDHHPVASGSSPDPARPRGSTGIGGRDHPHSEPFRGGAGSRSGRTSSARTDRRSGTGAGASPCRGGCTRSDPRPGSCSDWCTEAGSDSGRVSCAGRCPCSGACTRSTPTSTGTNSTPDGGASREATNPRRLYRPTMEEREVEVR
jgi:hypothetical protein